MKRFRFSGRAAVVCSLILAVGLPATAVGFGEGRSLLAGKRNPGYPHALNAETQIIADNATYGTRQSNLRNGDGGGAIYGCRSATGKEPCVRANNLSTGRAFEFATDGNEGGRITTKDANGRPFTTTATGVATGLNADRVDGKDATDFAAAGDLLFASVLDSASAAPTATGRGVTPTVGKTTAGANTVFTVTFTKDVSKCSYTASPVGAATTSAPGVAPVAGTPAAVAVNVADPSPYSFHLQVIC